MDIQLIEGQNSDFDLLKDYMLEIEKFHLNLNDYLKENDSSIDFSYFSNKTVKTWLIKFNNESVGFCRIQLNKTPSFTNYSTIFIDSIYITEKYRNQGIGKIVLKKIEEFAKLNKYDSLLLNVWSFNKKAELFYRNNNYIDIRATKIKFL